MEDGAGTPGDGPIVQNGATLRFENSADIVVTNAISGVNTYSGCKRLLPLMTSLMK